ncbi:hypothetical protein B0H14DRAFT_2587471 [Mycena olivaceomarginata]|nr:hypothetical protein B0H14DRAFT_2587471 [Mycena olivaceomarginata]
MPINRRYCPYPPPTTPALRPPPAPSPQTLQLLKTAREQLTFYNSAGLMVTWGGADWDILARPTRKTANSSIYVGAASFPSVPNFAYPNCPHLDAHGHPYAPMQLHLSKKLDHVKQDFFRAGDHICDFIVLIPKVRPSVYSTSDEVMFQEESPSSSSSSSIDEVDSLINWNPRVPASTTTTPATSPMSSPTPTPLRKKRGFVHLSRYSEGVSAARAISDLRVVNACWDGVITGRFETNPSSHPAFPQPGASTHPVLQPYDEHSYPGCLQRTFAELQFLDTCIGQALRALNSTFGIHSDVLQEILRDCTDCSSCKCHFSFDGFNRHIRGGFCGNTPTQTTITPKPTVDRLPHELALRELPAGKELGFHAEFLESPIGAALLELNSPLGVPLDVWALASTATIECEDEIAAGGSTGETVAFPDGVKGQSIAEMPESKLCHFSELRRAFKVVENKLCHFWQQDNLFNVPDPQSFWQFGQNRLVSGREARVEAERWRLLGTKRTSLKNSFKYETLETQIDYLEHAARVLGVDEPRRYLKDSCEVGVHNMGIRVKATPSVSVDHTSSKQEAAIADN